LDLIVPEAGAIYVMDRGYVDVRGLCTLHQAGACFVRRAKRNMKYHRAFRIQSIRRQASAPIKASRSTGSIRGGTILRICAASAYG